MPLFPYTQSFHPWCSILYLLLVQLLIKVLKAHLFLHFFSHFSLPQMFHAFGSLPPRALTVLTPTTVVLTFARIVDFNLLPLRFRLALPGFPLIFLRSIAESPVFNQPELPSHMKDRNVIYIWNWSPFCLLSLPLSLPFLLPLKTSSDFSCGRTLRGKPRFTYLAVLILALIPSENVAAPLD